MLSIYIACLIIGGVLLLFSVFAGGDHGDADAGHELGHGSDFDHDIDLDHDVQIDAAEDIEIHADHGLDSDVENISSADAVKFISFRNIIFFLAFFGLTGTSLTVLSIGTIVTLGSAIGIGAFSAVLGFRFMKYLKENESGEGFDIYKLKGREAIVTLPLSKERTGKVKVSMETNTIDILAKASDIAKKESYAPGDKVLIIEVRNDHVYIVDSKL